MPHIISQDLHNKLISSDPNLAQLVFSVANFWGDNEEISCIKPIELRRTHLVTEKGSIEVSHSVRLKKVVADTIRTSKVKCALFKVKKQLSHSFLHDKSPDHAVELVSVQAIPIKNNKYQYALNHRASIKKNIPYQFSFLFDAYGRPKGGVKRGLSGFEELAKVMANNTAITSIDTVSDDIATKMQDERDAKVLLKAFRTLPNLRTLNLDTCKLGNEAFHHLCEILKNDSSALVHLTISSADVCNHKGKLLQLYDAVKMNTSLRHISIAHPGLFNHKNITHTSSLSSEKSIKPSMQKTNSKSQSAIITSNESDPEEIIQAIYGLVDQRRDIVATPLVNQSVFSPSSVESTTTQAQPNSPSNNNSENNNSEVVQLRTEVSELRQQVATLTNLLTQVLQGGKLEQGSDNDPASPSPNN